MRVRWQSPLAALLIYFSIIGSTHAQPAPDRPLAKTPLPELTKSAEAGDRAACTELTER